MEIITIEMVYNPNSGEYETVYMVRYDDNNIVRIYYTYKVVKVPIYRVNEDGTRGEIIGYKYIWSKIPNLTAIGFDLELSRKIMIFNP
jgi:hypothetical protein